jgi:hypothetical protein
MVRQVVTPSPDPHLLLPSLKSVHTNPWVQSSSLVHRSHSPSPQLSIGNAHRTTSTNRDSFIQAPPRVDYILTRGQAMSK